MPVYNCDPCVLGLWDPGKKVSGFDGVEKQEESQSPERLTDL